MNNPFRRTRQDGTALFIAHPSRGFEDSFGAISVLKMLNQTKNIGKFNESMLYLQQKGVKNI